MADETTTTRARIRQAIWDWLSMGYPSRSAFEERRAADLADRIERALVGETLKARRELEAEVQRLLSLHHEGGTALICGGHSEPEIARQHSAGYIVAPAERYPLIAALLSPAARPEGTHEESE